MHKSIYRISNRINIRINLCEYYVQISNKAKNHVHHLLWMNSWNFVCYGFVTVKKIEWMQTFWFSLINAHQIIRLSMNWVCMAEKNNRIHYLYFMTPIFYETWIKNLENNGIQNMAKERSFSKNKNHHGFRKDHSTMSLFVNEVSFGWFFCSTFLVPTKKWVRFNLCAI